MITGGPRVAVPRGPRTSRWPAVGVAIGLVVMVIGTFLPWLRSGNVERNSYSAEGALRQVLDLGGVAGTVLTVWPFLSLLCALALALLILRLTRSGTGLAVVCALAAGAVCVALLPRVSSGLVGVIALGPAVSLAGAVVIVLTVLFAVLRTALGASRPKDRASKTELSSTRTGGPDDRTT